MVRNLFRYARTAEYNFLYNGFGWKLFDGGTACVTQYRFPRHRQSLIIVYTCKLQSNTINRTLSDSREIFLSIDVTRICVTYVTTYKSFDHVRMITNLTRVYRLNRENRSRKREHRRQIMRDHELRWTRDAEGSILTIEQRSISHFRKTTRGIRVHCRSEDGKYGSRPARRIVRFCTF